MPLPETQAKIDRALELRREGKSYGQISKDLGVGETTVRRYLYDPQRRTGLQGRVRWGDIVPIDIAEPYWARQQKEPPKAFSAFEAYRDMDPAERTYKKAAAAIGTSFPRAVDWSKKYRW